MKKLMIGLLFIASQMGMAHEGHDVPGSMPLPPHGGKVIEAEHVSKAHESHNHAGEDELFFEAVYSQKQIKVYPLLLKASDTSRFVSLDPDKALKGVSLSVELPRKKETVKLTATSKKDSLLSNYDAKGAHRFILHVNAVHNKEPKLAKIQLESR